MTAWSSEDAMEPFSSGLGNCRLREAALCYPLPGFLIFAALIDGALLCFILKGHPIGCHAPGAYIWHGVVSLMIASGIIAPGRRNPGELGQWLELAPR
jgi:hypothetical protein